MAVTHNSHFGFETESLAEEVVHSTGSPAIDTSAPSHSGTGSLKLNGAATAPTAAFSPFDGGQDSVGTDQVVGFWFRTNDITPTNDVDILLGESDSGIHIRLRFEASTGDLILVTAAGSEASRETAPFTVDTWHFIELHWQQVDAGSADVEIDGNATSISEVSTDFRSGGEVFDSSNNGWYRFQGGTTTGENIFIDDCYCLSDATGATGDFYGDFEVFAY